MTEKSIKSFLQGLLLIIFLLLTLNQKLLIAQADLNYPAQNVVQELYRAVSFTPGNLPDWDRVRAMFLEKAVIILRTAPNKTSIFTVDGFIQDFITFANRPDVTQAGFKETIKKIKTTVMGDMAHIAVLYEAKIPGRDLSPQQGVDLFLLVKKNNHWNIAAVTNEIPTTDTPVPDNLFN